MTSTPTNCLWCVPHAVKIIDLEGLTMRDVGSSAFKW